MARMAAASFPVDDLERGSLLAKRYRVTEFLGHGGMGLVYAALDLTTGTPVAVHHRADAPDGSKRVWWTLPDGTRGLGAIRVDHLPPYRSEVVARQDPDRTVVVCEGEKATDAVAAVGVLALGTVTGAATCHAADALADIAPGRRFWLWPYYW